MSVSEIFEIPKFYYFESGNDFSGMLLENELPTFRSERLTPLTVCTACRLSAAW